MNSTQTVAAVKAILPAIATVGIVPSAVGPVTVEVNSILAKASNPTLPCLDRLVDAATKAGLTVTDTRKKANYWTA